MILLIGAPGTIGTHTALGLLERVGASGVRAVAVDDVAVGTLRELGVTDVVRADLRQPASIDAAMDGVDRLVLITPFVPDQELLETTAMDAAARRGVQRVVELSPTHEDREAYPRTPANSVPHVRSETHAADSGLPVTVVRAEAFATNLPAQVPAIAAGVVSCPAAGARMTWTDVEDVGESLAAVADADEPGPDTVQVTGPEALTFAEPAERITSAVGHPVRYVDAEPEPWREQPQAAGLPPFRAAALVEEFTCYRDHGPVLTDTVAHLLGRPARPVDAFLRSRLAPAVAGVVAGVRS